MNARSFESRPQSVKFGEYYKLKASNKQLLNRNLPLNYAMALKLSQSVVAKIGGTITKISKSELLNWKFCLISEKAAIFAQHGVLFVTVTTIVCVCT